MIDNEYNSILTNELDTDVLDVIEYVDEDIDLSDSPYEQESRLPNFPPFFPGNYFPGGNFPGGNFPGGNFPNQPGNFPPNNQNPNIPPPPNYTPSKNDSQVKSLKGGVNTKAVSANSMRFCLYKHTYIWEESGRSYWIFLIYVDNKTASGFRWFRNRWGYFGIDLKKIDSFICYRNDTCDTCNTSDNRGFIDAFINTKKEFSLNLVRDTYSKDLMKFDNITPYSRLSLDISIPENINEYNRSLILSYADIVSNECLDKLQDLRNDITVDTTSLIENLLRDFNCMFQVKLDNLQLTNQQLKNIHVSINSNI